MFGRNTASSPRRWGPIDKEIRFSDGGEVCDKNKSRRLSVPAFAGTTICCCLR